MQRFLIDFAVTVIKGKLPEKSPPSPRNLERAGRNLHNFTEC